MKDPGLDGDFFHGRDKVLDAAAYKDKEIIEFSQLGKQVLDQGRLQRKAPVKADDLTDMMKDLSGKSMCLRISASRTN